MALPIAPTPILEGEEATIFLKKLLEEEGDEKPLVPTPKLDKVREKILSDARRPKK